MPKTSFSVLAYTTPMTSFTTACAPANPTFVPSVEPLPTSILSIKEDDLDVLVEEQPDCSEREDKEACVSDRRQVFGQLMDKLCAQNGGLQQQQVAATQIQDLFTNLEVELKALQKESKALNNAVTCMNAAQEKKPLLDTGKWPKLQEGTFNLVGRIFEKAEANLGSATVGINEHIVAVKLSNETLTSWSSSTPLQQQSEKVAQKFCEALGPVWQGAESFAKDAQSEFAKTAAVVSGKQPLFKTWLEDPFASVSKKLEAASQKFEADASRFMDRIEALKHPVQSDRLFSTD
mmetsp:Transcript_34742/g.67007  ORF Transcript_34742/g.67007 Transcript_34742/m.67007 type:complete len:291 (+) Transcript_34742:111-983(+)